MKNDEKRNAQLEKLALDMLYRAGDTKDVEAAKLLHMAAEIILATVRALRA